MDTNAFIREHLPGRFQECGGELQLRLDATVELTMLARDHGLTLLGVEYFTEVSAGHVAVGVDYRPDNVPAADHYAEFEAKWASGFPRGATLAVFGYH
jgi:hypothetical protein